MPIEISTAIITAVLAFAFGLISKFLIDQWQARKEKKSLTVIKRVKSSYSANDLDEEIQKKAYFAYNQTPIKSLQVFEVEIVNSGHQSVKNQAFTIRFDKDSEIIDTPKYLGSTENKRFVKEDRTAKNAHRIIIELLQKGHQLSWEFTVIDHISQNFQIEHGIHSDDTTFENVDLDVESTITSSKTQMDFLGGSRTSLILLVTSILVLILRETLHTYFMPVLPTPYHLVLSSLLSVLFVILAILFLSNAIKTLPLAIKFLQSLLSDRDRTNIYTGGGTFVGGNVGTSGGAFAGGVLSPDGSLIVGKQSVLAFPPPPYQIGKFNEMLHVYDSIKALSIEENEKQKLVKIIHEIEEEMNKKEQARVSTIIENLATLQKESETAFEILSGAIFKPMPQEDHSIIFDQNRFE